MSVCCGLECVVFLGCSRWAWKRLTYIGSYDSESWPQIADMESLEAIPRACRSILAVYEEDLSQPRFPPAGGYCDIDPSLVVRRTTYSDLPGAEVPPYLIYVDPEHREIVLAIRGLNLIHESDYKVLMDNSLGKQMFDGGFVHHGLLKAATWLLNREAAELRRLWLERGQDYRLVIAGHSLGSGIAALMTVIIVNHRDRLGGIPRNQVRCFAIAPARCMSLNLAVKYADVINSVVLQDDFLPRTPTPLEYIFGSIFCLPCLLFLICMRDTFIPEGRKIKDPRRLYAPGRIYHIVERKFCRCGRFPPIVRTAIPVEGRFEHIVLSCNTMSDHGIIWIEREAHKALQVMKESAEPTVRPELQRMERRQTLEKEHRDALERAVTLHIPHAVPLDKEDSSPTPAVNTAEENIPNKGKPPSETSPDSAAEDPTNMEIGASSSARSKSASNTNWDELVQKLFDRIGSGNLVLKKSLSALDEQ